MEEVAKRVWSEFWMIAGPWRAWVGTYIQVRCAGCACVSTVLRCARHSPQIEKLPQVNFVMVDAGTGMIGG